MSVSMVALAALQEKKKLQYTSQLSLSQWKNTDSNELFDPVLCM